MSFMNSSALDDLARRLAEAIPASVRNLGQDLETNFKAVLQAQLAKLGIEPRIRSQQDLAKFMADEAQQWAKMVSSAEIKLD